jgi:hypothetical protein
MWHWQEDTARFVLAGRMPEVLIPFMSLLVAVQGIVFMEPMQRPMWCQQTDATKAHTALGCRLKVPPSMLGWAPTTIESSSCGQGQILPMCDPIFSAS